MRLGCRDSANGAKRQVTWCLVSHVFGTWCVPERKNSCYGMHDLNKPWAFYYRGRGGSLEHSIIEEEASNCVLYIDIECFTSLREYFTHMRRSPINNVNRQCKTDMINKSWFHVLIRRNILGAVLYLWSDHFPLTFMAALHVRLFLR